MYSLSHHLIIRGEGYSTSELLHELPENLKDEVVLNELGGILQNVPFFEGIGDNFLKKVTKIVSSNLHCPGDFVYHAGDLGEEMYFVRRGFVEILSEDLSNVVNKLGSGGYFGEVSIIAYNMCSKYSGYQYSSYYFYSACTSSIWFSDDQMLCCSLYTVWNVKQSALQCFSEVCHLL